MPSHVAIEHFRAGGDFRARATDDSVHEVPTQETVVGRVLGEESKDSAAWNACDHYAQERDQDSEEPAANFAGDGEHYDEQHYEAGSNEGDTDDHDRPWTESAAAIMDSQDFPASYETRMDDSEFRGGGMQAFLLDPANKDLLSVVHQCYQTSKLLSHHEDISQELQVTRRRAAFLSRAFPLPTVSAVCRKTSFCWAVPHIAPAACAGAAPRVRTGEGGVGGACAGPGTPRGGAPARALRRARLSDGGCRQWASRRDDWESRCRSLCTHAGDQRRRRCDRRSVASPAAREGGASASAGAAGRGRKAGTDGE
jgi:hypothetical protein